MMQFGVHPLRIVEPQIEVSTFSFTSGSENLTGW